MPLPALLLERLKRRKIIREIPLKSHAQTDVARPLDQAPTPPSASSIESKQHHYDYREPGPGSEVNAQDQGHEQTEEEIIAEDYSDEEEVGEIRDQDEKAHDSSDSSKSDNHSDSQYRDNDISRGSNDYFECAHEDKCNDQVCISSKNQPVLGCPNKYNIYHDCSQYCVDNYSKPENVSPTMEQRKQLAMILRTYPIPNDWRAVYDPGVKTFYFWNTLTNLVSWFPPGMNGFISVPAEQIRKSMKELEEQFPEIQ